MEIIEPIFDTLDKISIVAGLIAAMFSVLVWIKLRRQNKQLLEIASTSPKIENFKELVDYHKDITTTSPYAFAVCLLTTSDSIKGDVERFLKSKGHEWEKMPIEELNMNGLNVGNLEDFINTLRIKRRQFEAQNATEIHLFIAGPIQAGTLIGAMFDNWRPVKLYHKDRGTGNYECWCHLTK